MPSAFLFRCPHTGFNVQGWTAEDHAALADDVYESVTCTACARMHLVNPKTGKVLGAEEG